MVKPWIYGVVIITMACVQGMSRLGTSITAYECTRRSAKEKLSHERAVTRIGIYLIDIIDRVLVYKVDKTRGL